jgi:very-short-patch-repair endonuclease
MSDWRALAERQYAVISRLQMRSSGLTNRQIERLVASVQLERVYPAVYRVAGSYPSARQSAMAALLWCGPSSFLSHATAASLLQVPCPADPVAHVTAPRATRRTSPTVHIHRPTELTGRDRLEVDGLACTSGTRTVIDLASVLDGERLEHAFDTARRLGLTTLASLERRCAELTRVPKPIRALLQSSRQSATESRLEVKAARLLRRNGLVPPASQLPAGRYRIDFAWPDKLVGIECDGFEWHGDRLAWKRDRRRLAELEHAGWRIVHWTWEDVTARSDGAIARLRHALSI